MRTWVLIAAMTTALAAPAFGESLLKEGFDGGNRDGWHLTSGGAATVADDPKLGSGNALALATHAGSSQRRLLANFKAVELAKTGDAIVLRFDYRITGSPDAVRGRGDAEGGFRFGLFDSRGTLQTSDATTGGSSGEAVDDVGYLAMTSVGARNRARLVEEGAEDAYFMGGTDLKFLQTDDVFGGINDSLKHAAAFTITRLGSTAIGLEVVVDGKSIRTEVTDGLRTRFDEVGFAASHRAADFVIDNIEVTSGTSPAATSSASGAPTVRARCEPCTVEVATVTTMTADVPAGGGGPLTYRWSAPTGKFADPTARQTSWTAPMRKGWSEERWKAGGGVPITVTVDNGRGTASDTVTVEVIRPAAK